MRNAAVYMYSKLSINDKSLETTAGGTYKARLMAGL
jgi:hypothetical protein